VSAAPGPPSRTGGGVTDAPHASNPIGPLWNRPDPGHYYEVYRSSTLVATVGQPTGSAKVLLRVASRSPKAILEAVHT
jgi:hypothetical protein